MRKRSASQFSAKENPWKGPAAADLVLREITRCHTSPWSPSGRVCFHGAECEVQNNESIYRFISDNILPPMAIARARTYLCIAAYLHRSVLHLGVSGFGVRHVVEIVTTAESVRKSIRSRVRRLWRIDRCTRLSPEITATVITFNRQTQF